MSIIIKSKVQSPNGPEIKAKMVDGQEYDLGAMLATYRAETDSFQGGIPRSDTFYADDRQLPSYLKCEDCGGPCYWHEGNYQQGWFCSCGWCYTEVK
jgi:hypothetical protein